MTSLLEKINTLNDYDDYKKEESKSPKIDDWNNQTQHKNFIEYFLESSGKASIVKEFFQIDLNNFERATHTNSVFFVGTLLYKNLNFKDKIKFTRNEINEFYFIWFLTSLVHDFGDDIEKNKDNYPKVTSEIKSLKEMLNINTNDLLQQPLDKYSENMKKLIKHISPYYKERFEGKQGSSSNGKIDHGIASGLILYDGLVKNREKKEEEYGEIQKLDNNSSIYWAKELEKFYAYASYSIAIHNIRYPENSLKFSIEEDPFLFLFWLADTIEPIKSFQTEECLPSYILENIIIEFHNNKKGFTIKNNKDSKLDFSEYKNKIYNLIKFLKIDINTKKKNIIKLSW
ncbi:MAG: hypothetical protein GQ570_02560 [Helicobacteraceae bacterium]|nr:hypothetical protein [Helicobacteraceae bacterium]